MSEDEEDAEETRDGGTETGWPPGNARATGTDARGGQPRRRPSSTSCRGSWPCVEHVCPNARVVTRAKSDLVMQW